MNSNTDSENKPYLSINFMVAGCMFEGRQPIIKKHVKLNDKAILTRDKQNKFSKYAVKVFTTTGKNIGFVPEFYAEEIANELDNNAFYEAFFTKILSNEILTPVVQCYFYKNQKIVDDHKNQNFIEKFINWITN